MPERPINDPLTDSLTELSEAERGAAMTRFRALRPHIQDGVSLATRSTRAASVLAREPAFQTSRRSA